MRRDMGVEEWWREFFDARYVEAWGQDGAFDDSDEIVTGVLSLLDLPSGAAVLDIPCGFGRIAGPLHERGHRVTGVDLSDEQLAIARRSNPGPTYVAADMRRPPDGPYDAVLNIFNSFGYFADPEDDLAALTAWRRVLRPGGALMMTLANRDALAATYADPDAMGTPDLPEYAEIDWVRGWYMFSRTYGDGRRAVLRIRMYTATELCRLLERAGFGRIEVFGDLRRAPLTPRNGLTVIARRPGD